MSSTEQNISATSVTADSANIGAINSGSITNTNGIKTDSLGVEGSALIGGNLSVNGAAEIMGALNAHGGISFNNVAFIRDGGDFSVNGTLTTTNGANFGNESIIGVDTWTQDIHGKEIPRGFHGFLQSCFFGSFGHNVKIVQIHDGVLLSEFFVFLGLGHELGKAL